MRVGPISGFDREHYIFIGEVVEVIESVNFKSRGVKSDAVGLKIKVSENIYLPKLASYYEVFPLRLTSWCGLMSETKEVREHYPVGSQVRVVAKEATTFKDEPVSSAIRLETSIYNKGSISRNDLSAKLKTSAKTIFDYENFSYKTFASNQYPTAVAERIDAASNNFLPEFELRKDLFRLQKVKSEAEKIKILERLVFYPDVDDVSFLNFVGYLQDQDKQLSLAKQWEARVKEIHSKRQRY
jgi:hypothetical protein